MIRLSWLIPILLCVQSWATWTSIQTPATNIDNGCSGTTCTVTVASTGSGHLLIAGVTVNSNTGITISSVTAGACNSAWTHAPNTAVSFAGNGSSDIYYCTNSVSGQTSIVITVSGTGWTGGGGAGIWEASSSNGSIAIDSGANPSNNVTDASCTACAGVSLTLGGNNDYFAAISICGGGGCSGVTGTGWAFDTSVSGQGWSHGISSGSQTAPATWTQGSAGAVHANAAAFQESAGAVPNLTIGGKAVIGGKVVAQ
jgi:hypothetical protein